MEIRLLNDFYEVSFSVWLTGDQLKTLNDCAAFWKQTPEAFLSDKVTSAVKMVLGE